MDVFKNINEYIDKWCSNGGKEGKFFRYLFCRLLDAYEMFPKELRTLVDIDDYFRDFISYDPDNSYELKKGRECYTLNVHLNHEVRDIINIRFPSCILEDNWEEKLSIYLSDKKRNELVKNIEKLEEFLKTGPDELKRLRKELSELDNL